MTRFITFFTILFLLIKPSFSAILPTDKGNSIFYTDVGKGAPLVLIHAFPTDQSLWNPQRKALKHHFRVITLDLSGFGRSSPVKGQALTMSNYASEVKVLLDHLHIQRAVIGGESMGGYVALAFYAQYPNRVDGLILSGTQAIADSDAAKVKREVTAVEILEQGPTNYINGFLPKALSEQASEHTQLFLRRIIERQTSTAMASALRGMALRHDTSDILANANIPTLIITGEKDIVISPEQSQRMHALAKGSQLTIIANAGHLASLERPQEWNQAVIEMFSK
jgi:pimeloyl-ACP methyl ester carboxylesterase